jgi:lipopolysaccharide transport system ATP-binding protein
MGSITVTNLGKAYKQYPARSSRLREWLLPFQGPQHKLKWILQDINFHVAPGEAVGLIGINGAGKSTLLKLITGTTQPTTARSTWKAGWRHCWNWAWVSTPTSRAARTSTWPASCWA